MDCLKSVFCCGAADMAIEPSSFQLDNEFHNDYFAAFSLTSNATEALQFLSGGFSLQHPIKAASSGVNADKFISSEASIAVADGVSSVESEGFDPSKLPAELLLRCVKLCESYNASPSTFNAHFSELFRTHNLPFSADETPKQILAVAGAECREMGSTTACFGMLLNPSQQTPKSSMTRLTGSSLSRSTVLVGNVGDSQMIQLRRRNVKKGWRFPQNASESRKRTACKEYSPSSQKNRFESQLYSRSTSTIPPQDLRCPREALITPRPHTSSHDRQTSNGNSSNASTKDPICCVQHLCHQVSNSSTTPSSDNIGDVCSSSYSEDNLPTFALVSRTQTQQHFFNCPYQLTRMPDVDNSFGEVLKRTASIIAVSSHPIEEGDVLIFGSDGLFDNLFDYEIIGIVENSCRQYVNKRKISSNIGKNDPAVISDDLWWLSLVPPEYVARSLVEAALEAATPVHRGRVNGKGSSMPFMQKKHSTPFATSMSYELGRSIEGGKPDDTTVVVSFVVSKDHGL